MKIRNGFVSNSSSSSFILLKRGLSDDVIDKIINHKESILEYVKEHNSLFDSYTDYENIYEDFGCIEQYWSVTESKYYVGFETSMDNFDLINYMKKLGVTKKNWFMVPDPYINWSDPVNFDVVYKEYNFKNRKNKLKKLLR